MSQSYQLSEVFRSVQAEGALTGTLAVFVRFAGCNLNCPWCDTNPSSRYLVEENMLLNRIAAYHPKPPMVVLTGGEPTLQVTDHLVAALHAMHYRVAMETNGTKKPPKGIDWLTVSPKPGAPVAVHTCNEVKVVLTEDTDPQQLAWPIRAEYYWVQACSLNHEAALRYVQEHPEWRLSVQWNQLIGWR